MDHKEFGACIARLIAKGDLSRQEAETCFKEIVNDSQSDMQQGAFLAALTAKGPTAGEVAGIWQVLYQHDTEQVEVQTEKPLVENCGSGMDAFKTFNISTAAAVIAAADGVAMARHGSRAVSSSCGTVDIVEQLGVDVECSPQTVARSIESAGIGLFNGMSPLVHPRALGRILSKTAFGSVLNTAASLANPARPRLAVRGVCCPDLMLPTARAMHEIGYQRALVVYGECPGPAGRGIDEASTMGDTLVLELFDDGTVSDYKISPRSLGIQLADPTNLAMGPDKDVEAGRLHGLLAGEEARERSDIACLNAGLIFYVAGLVPTIADGYERASGLLQTSRPVEKLGEWVSAQQEATDPCRALD